MNATCPCCGQAVEATKLLVDLGANVVSIGGQSAKVAPRVAEIVSVLAEAAPMFVTCDALAAQVWGAANAVKKAPSIRTHVREIRKALEPLGFGVENAWGGAYRLAPLVSPAAAKNGHIKGRGKAKAASSQF